MQSYHSRFNGAPLSIVWCYSTKQVTDWSQIRRKIEKNEPIQF